MVGGKLLPRVKLVAESEEGFELLTRIDAGALRLSEAFARETVMYSGKTGTYLGRPFCRRYLRGTCINSQKRDRRLSRRWHSTAEQSSPRAS